MKNKKSLRDYFTTEELEALRKYIEDVNAWSAEEPSKLTKKEINSILQYAQEHDDDVPPEYMDRVIIVHCSDLHEDGSINPAEYQPGSIFEILSINPAEYQPGSIFEIHSDNITFDKDFEGYLKGDPQAPTYRRILCDVIYDTWYQKIYDIAPAETIIKLIDLTNNARETTRDEDLIKGYIPEDEDNRARLEAAIRDLLGETVTKEDISNAAGVLVTFPEKSSQLLITHPGYQYALLPYKNNKAYIVDFDKQLKFTFDESGEPIIDLSTPEDYDAYTSTLNKDQISANIADTDLLSTLAAAVLSSYCSNYGDKITVYYPNFAKALGVKFDGADSKNNHFDIWDKIKQLENIGGVLVEDKSILRAFVMLGYNKEDNTMTFSSPYLYRLMDILKKNPVSVSRIKKNDKPLWEIIGTSFLVDNSIITARNKITTQLVKNLIAGVYQRGSRTEAAKNPGKQYTDNKLIEYRISFRLLIERTPLLSEALHNTKPTGKTRILSRAFLGSNYTKSGKTIIEEYMEKYTHAFEYWKDLKIEIPTPSMKSLNDVIVISHHGINGHFHNDLYIPTAEKTEEIDV